MKAYFAKLAPTLLLLLLAVGLTIPLVPPAAAPNGELPPGWLPGYTYRKKHLIVGAPNAGIGYQMFFIVRRATGTDTNYTVYVSTKCKEDFSDVRFADANGNVFPYAIVYRTTDEAWFWIKPSVDLSSNQYIYIYYGNPDARDESNLDQTFIFAESWDNATLNTSRWIVETVTNYTVNVGQRRLELQYNTRLRTKTLSFPSSYVVESFLAKQYESEGSRSFRIYCPICGPTSSDWDRLYFSIYCGPWQSSDPGIAFSHFYLYNTYSSSYWYIYCGVGHNNDWTLSGSPRRSIDATLLMSRNASGYLSVWLNGTMRVAELNNESPDRIYISFTASSSTPSPAYVYAFKIRKFVSPEPSHGEWFAEESITVTHAKLNVNVEPSFLSYVAFTLDYPTNVLFAPYSAILSTGTHTLTVLDTKVRVNATHVYGFKCWKKNGEIVSFDKSYTFTLQAGTTNIAMVFVAHNVSIVSDPEMYVRLEVDGWQVQTPTNIYRGTGYYNFRVLDTQLYYNATHILRFYGWYVDNVYIGGSDEVNIYISYNTRIKLAYRFAEIPAPPPMTFKAQIVELGTVLAGTSKDFAITVIFDANSITIQSVEFTAKAEWLQVVDALPIYATKGVEAIGTATINCRLTLPQNVQGYYTIPYKITAKTSGEVTVTTASYMTFTATTTPTAVKAISAQPTPIGAGYTETVIRIIGNPIILILLIALTIWLAT